MNLNQSINIRKRFLRSVNIAKDQKFGLAGDQYIITPLVQQTLDLLSPGLTQGDFLGDRAFTLTGPYGSGKSAFALFLSQLLTTPTNPAWDNLQATNAGLAKSLHSVIFGKNTGGRGFVVLPINSRRASIADLILEALEDAPDDVKSAIIREMVALQGCRDSKTIVRLVEKVAANAVSLKYNGVFFVFDEFGKVFEEAYYNRKNSDIFVLQELAEAASRSRSAPILLLCMLHQAFGSYIDDYRDARAKAEFAKIEGRFHPITFVETPAAQIRLLASAFESGTAIADQNPAFLSTVSKAVGPEIQLHLIAGVDAREFTGFARAAYPFHPLTMLALPLLFRRFGQNERSIFSYLASNEPLALQSFLSNSRPGQLLGLTDLFDYLLGNHETYLSRHPQGKALLEANDRINSKASLTSVERDIVKSVAVLSVLGTQSHLKASSVIIGFAVADPFGREVLDRLVAQSILVYRRLNDSYAIWEGSDVDLVACGILADRAVSRGGLGMADVLERLVPPRPIVAKRHSFRTGVLRYFGVRYVDSPDHLSSFEVNRVTSNGAVGQILVCLAHSEAVRETFEIVACELSRRETSLVIAIPEIQGELREALLEVQRLRWIEDNVKELRDDRVARREVAIRIADAIKRVVQQQTALLDPRVAPRGSSCQWYWNGEPVDDVRVPRDVSVLLSATCDSLYESSPRIRNELICRREISTQAAAARNNLVKRIIDPESLGLPCFGIEGFPPERSICESLFVASRMLRIVDGRWVFGPPAEGEAGAGLRPCWELLENEVFCTCTVPICLTELYAKLRAKPFGLPDGVLPLLLVSFYEINRNHVTLYFEGSYLPDPQAANFELLTRRPELFAIAGARHSGVRRKVVERLANGLKVEPFVGPVVRYLYRWFSQLPRYATNTNRLGGKTLAFRQAFLDAKSPEKLLFVDLPAVFGLSSVGDEDGGDGQLESYFEQLNRCIGELGALLPQLVAEQREILLQACDLPNSPDGWSRLYDLACFLAPRIDNVALVPFIQTVMGTAGDWNKADRVIGALVSCPMANWGTLELTKFKGLAVATAELFLDAYMVHAPLRELTGAEFKLADDLAQKIKTSVLVGFDNPRVARAALARCLKELDEVGR